MQRNKVDNVEQAVPADRLPRPPTTPDLNQPLPDWREVGRRVLSESMRRTARELRRRNGCTVHPGRFRGKWRGLS